MRLTIACTGVREPAGFEIENLSRVPGDAQRSRSRNPTGPVNLIRRSTFSFQSVLLLTSTIAILLGLFYQGRKLSEQAREIATFRNFVGYEWPNAPQEPDTFDYHWELLANNADLKLYLFTVRSGDPHELLFNVNGTVTAVESYYDPIGRTNTSKAAVSIDWISDDKIKITLTDPQATGRVDFATRKSIHIFHTITDDFKYDEIVYPEFNTMGEGCNGVYSWYDEPLELFHWNGNETASVHVRFKNRSPDGRTGYGVEETAGTKR